MICDRYKISKEDVDILKEVYGQEKTDELYNALIQLARERARLHCLPAQWQVWILDDGNAVVKRYRNSPQVLVVEAGSFVNV